jgi:hypothetical protein
MAAQPVPVRFAPPEPGTPDLVAAVALALAVMTSAKVTSWGQVGSAVPDQVDLTDDQVALLNAHRHLFGLIRPTVRATGGTPGVPGLTLAVCGSCGRWLVLVVSAAPPTSCLLTRDCSGTVWRATPAKRDTEPAPQDEPATESQFVPSDSF